MGKARLGEKGPRLPPPWTGEQRSAKGRLPRLPQRMRESDAQSATSLCVSHPQGPSRSGTGGPVPRAADLPRTVGWASKHSTWHDGSSRRRDPKDSFRFTNSPEHLLRSLCWALGAPGRVQAGKRHELLCRFPSPEAPVQKWPPEAGTATPASSLAPAPPGLHAPGDGPSPRGPRPHPRAGDPSPGAALCELHAMGPSEVTWEPEQPWVASQGRQRGAARAPGARAVVRRAGGGEGTRSGSSRPAAGSAF